jgi:2-methylcitrate dehydratase
MVLNGEPGLPSVLTAPKWGFDDVLFKGNRLKFQRPYGSYVMENVLFKISFPAEFHAQTAVECALQLHPLVRDRLDRIDRIELHTQEPAIRIISKTGLLDNPADRDHCLQYMVAVPLIHGHLTAAHYEDEFARDPRLDALRAKMTVRENPQFTRDYYDPAKRAIGNAVQVFFTDGTATALVIVEYPIGHRRRRAEGLPLLRQKFRDALATRFPVERVEQIVSLCHESAQFDETPVSEFVDRLVV